MRPDAVSPPLKLERDNADFWLSSGHFLLDENKDGSLILTDAFLKAFLARPELMPPGNACSAERALHAKLLKEPRSGVAPTEIEAIADEDARQNWRALLAFWKRLFAASTLEAAYLNIVRNPASRIAPLFLAQLTHAIARQALSKCDDPFVVRAGELFFRPQRVAIQNGAIMLADEEVINLKETEIRTSPLLSMFAGETAQMDILTKENAASYWDRSDSYDLILEFGTLSGGRASFAQALTLWARHLFGIDIEIEPVARIENNDVRWLLGLDAEASLFGNAIWHGEELCDRDTQNLVAFFEVKADSTLPFLDQTRGHPLYLLLAMDRGRIVRMKPQNLVTGLPFSNAALL